MRARAFRWVLASIIAGLAFAAAPASAQAQACNYDHYGRAYNCHHAGYVVPVYQPSCTSCGNRGLFTSGWTGSWGAPCGTCQQMYAPLQPCGACQQVYGPRVYGPAVYGPEVYEPRVGYAPQPVADDDDDDDGTPVYRGPRRGYGHGPWRTRPVVHRGPVRHHAPARHRERLPGGGY